MTSIMSSLWSKFKTYKIMKLLFNICFFNKIDLFRMRGVFIAVVFDDVALFKSKIQNCKRISVACFNCDYNICII